MTFYGTERFHEALPDETHAGEASYTEQTAFARGDASRRRNASRVRSILRTMMTKMTMTNITCRMISNRTNRRGQ